MELKAKFLKHKEILKFNCDEAEGEVIRLDEIYHDTVDMVLKVIKSYLIFMSIDEIQISKFIIVLKLTVQTYLFIPYL